MRKLTCSVEALYVGLLFTLCLQSLIGEFFITRRWRLIDVLITFVLRYWGDFWFFCGLCIACQVFLLLCPPGTTGRQEVVPPSMRFVILEWFLLLSILCTAFARWYVWSIFLLGYNWSLAVFGCVGANWLFWLWIFHGLHNHTTGNGAVRWIDSQLSKGNVLKLIVMEIHGAFIGQEEDPPPKGLTSFALATGAALMSFVFGPGVSFLFTDAVQAQLKNPQAVRTTSSQLKR